MALPLRALSRSSLRAAASGAPSVAAVARRRALHSLPSLPLPLRFTGASSSSDRACEPLFSRRTLDLIWEHYQRRLLARLNDLVRGTEYENSSLVETVIGSASNPSQILIFNTASQALNNAFFFHGLKPKELGTAPGMAWDQLPQPEPPKALLDRIETQWGSFAAFKDAFSATATGMSASGWVWLVRDQQGNLGIVPTHGAGTVLVQNRVQKNLGSTFEASVGIDAQGNPLPEAAAQRPQQQGRAASTSPFAAAPARSFSSSSAAASTYASAQRAFGQQPNDSKVGETLQPLLCLSVHEHAWLPDHGFEQDVYLQRFWECVNWTRVANLWDHGEAVYSD